jgi:hypothetical protein
MNRYCTLWCLAVAIVFLLAACQPEAPPPEPAEPQWWKGNLHTHSLWSDGDTYPEFVAGWYWGHDYNFLAVSDHNVLAEWPRWKVITETPGGQETFDAYVRDFGKSWVETREENGQVEVRLKTLEEYRGQFEEPGRFLLIPSEEITDELENKPIHVNAINVKDLIEPQGGETVLDVMQNNVNAVLEQRRSTDRKILAQLNHPNFGWAVTVEDMIALEGEMFFEVYNGHPAVRNDGDESHPSTERMWDMILTARISRGDGPIFGVAVDDAHHFLENGPTRANPGRGWIMVRAVELSAEAIIEAMEAAEFYASTGVVLNDVSSSNESISLTIQGEPGISYQTQFIGTRRVAEGETVVPEEMGLVLAEMEGLEPSYTFTGDEIYVRAKVISSEAKENPYREGEHEVAWTQPVVLPR